MTDTGRFTYENTGSRAHVMAADLIGAGIDVHAIYRRLYEGVPQGKLELLARGLSAVERFDGGLLTVTQLTREDYAVTGADESYSEGVVDHLRSVEGTAVAGLVRELLSDTAATRRKVSLRATDDRIDVSAIARALGGGRPPRGGVLDRHGVRRAGRVPAHPARAAALSQDGVLLVDKPAGVTSHDVVAAERRGLPRGARVGHAGTLDPFATGLLLVLIGRATRAQRFLMALPKRYETVARLGWTSTTGDPEGEVAPGRTPPEPLALPTGRIRQRPPAYSAVRIGRKRAYALARAGEAVDVPEREVEVHRFDELWRDGERAAFAIECGSGTYVRSLVADLGDAYCVELRRTAIGPFDVAEAGRLVPLGDALGFLPAVALGTEDGRRAGHGVAVPGTADAAVVRLVDDDGLIALAEPRGDGTLKPVVGFRG